MRREQWSIDEALMRGDTRDAVAVPDPDAPPSLVRHILYLEGAGRATPYCSVTEDEDSAERFAGKLGRLWFTTVARVEAQSLGYISKVELLGLLRGKGKGDAAWVRASEVQQARAYVEQWGEHLVDVRPMKGQDTGAVRAAISAVFTKERP